MAVEWHFSLEVTQQMRLISWNCKGAFGRKHASVAELAPDVLVLPECGRMRALNNVLNCAPVRSFEWIGDNPRKGLGVVSYGSYSLRVHPSYDPKLRWILPLDVDGPTPFTLIAVWTVPDSADGIYIHSLFRTLEVYAEILRAPRVVIAGDFNQSVLLDKPGSPLNFAEWLVKAETNGFRSTYHLHRNCPHGCEPEKTFYLHHKVEKGHHIDFVFATPSLIETGMDVEVGSHATWCKQSDHMPLTCTFGLRKRPG